MKYTEENVEKFVEAISNGLGRVRACKVINISYDTFTRWMREKAEFSELVKKAEEVGEDRIKDLAKRGVIEKFQTHWQSAAWWLERKYPEEYRKRNELDIKESEDVDLSVLTEEEIIKLAEIDEKLRLGKEGKI